MTAPAILGVGEVLWDLLPGGPRLGGAPCNFAFHCQQLGHPAAIVSRVGADDLGRKLRGELATLNLSAEYVQTDRERPTGTVKVDVQDGQPSYTIVEDVAYDHLAWDDSLESVVRSARAICFGTLAQRHSEARETIRRLLDTARDGNPAPTIIYDVNLRQPFYSREIVEQSLKRCDWVKVNAEELAVLANLLGLPRVSASDTLGRLRQRFGVSLACITRGAEGCLIQVGDDEVELPGVPVTVADTVGAGDAFTAGLLCLTLEGRSLDMAAAFANRYAARVAAEVGGTPSIARWEIEV